MQHVFQCIHVRTIRYLYYATAGVYIWQPFCPDTFLLGQIQSFGILNCNLDKTNSQQVTPQISKI